MAGELRVQMDVMRTSRTEAVIKMTPELGDELFESLMRAQGLLRGRRDRVEDADRLQELANAIAGAVDWSQRMAEGV